MVVRIYWLIILQRLFNLDIQIESFYISGVLMYTENNYIMWLSSLMSISVDAKSELIKALGSCENVWLADRKTLAATQILSDKALESIL